MKLFFHLMLGAVLSCIACGGVDEEWGEESYSEAELSARADCASATPDTVIELLPNKTLSGRSTRLGISRTVCPEPMLMSILLPTLAKARSRVTLQPAQGTISIWGIDAHGESIRTYVDVAFTYEKIEIDVSPFVELRAAFEPSTAADGYWDYTLERRGL